MGLINKLLHPTSSTVTKVSEQRYTRPANANELVIEGLKSGRVDLRDLRQVDEQLKTWGYTGAKATQPTVQKLVSQLGSMTPGKDDLVRLAVGLLRAGVPAEDEKALVDAIRMERAKNFIKNVDL